MAKETDMLIRDYRFGIVEAEMRARVPHNIRQIPLVPKRLAPSAHLMPALIDLRACSVEERNRLMAGDPGLDGRAQSPVVAVMLEGLVSTDEVERRWNATQLASLDQRHWFWMRMHDPRVLHQLFRVLSPEQCRYLFGRIAAVAYWVGGEWVINASHFDIPKGAVGARYGELSPNDWRRVMRIGLVNRALERACIWGAAELVSNGSMIEQALDCATSHHGLSQDDDLVEFAFRALTCSHCFSDDSRVAAAITRYIANQHQSRLSDHFALIDPSIWTELSTHSQTKKGERHDNVKKM